MSDLNEVTAELWNELYPVGTPVRYWSGIRKGKGVLTKTRAPAWTLSQKPEDAHLVCVEGCAGGISLTHVEAVTPLPSLELAKRCHRLLQELGDAIESFRNQGGKVNLSVGHNGGSEGIDLHDLNGELEGSFFDVKELKVNEDSK